MRVKKILVEGTLLIIGLVLIITLIGAIIGIPFMFIGALMVFMNYLFIQTDEARAILYVAVQVVDA